MPPDMEKSLWWTCSNGLQQRRCHLPRGPVQWNENSVWKRLALCRFGRFWRAGLWCLRALARQNEALLATLRALAEASEQAHSDWAWCTWAWRASWAMSPAPRPPLSLASSRVAWNNYWWGDHGTFARQWRRCMLLQSNGLNPENYGETSAW